MTTSDINLNDLTDDQVFDLWDAVHQQTDSIAMRSEPEDFLGEHGWSKQEIEQARIDYDGDLDDVVLEVAGRWAASINNNGEEVAVLGEHGWTEEDIKTYLGRD